MTLLVFSKGTSPCNLKGCVQIFMLGFDQKGASTSRLAIPIVQDIPHVSSGKLSVSVLVQGI